MKPSPRVKKAGRKPAQWSVVIDCGRKCTARDICNVLNEEHLTWIFYIRRLTGKTDS